MENLELKINLNFKQLATIVKQLSPSEKLKLNDVIWEGNMTIPEEHKKIVLQRIRKAKQNPERMLSWDKALKTLKP